MKHTLIILAFSLTLTATAFSQERFAFISGQKTWQQANLDAMRQGGHLATFSSEAEWSEMTNALGGIIPFHCWIGGTNSPADGTNNWRWITSEPISYSRWAVGEPNNDSSAGGEHFLMVYPSDSVFSGYWNDANGTILWNTQPAFAIGGYILEYDPKVELIKYVKPTYAFLRVGTNYQLQLSSDLINWTNHGAIFTATNKNMTSSEYWDVDNWNKLFFRLLVAP